jgi:purine-nucleoside phosphorylase
MLAMYDKIQESAAYLRSIVVSGADQAIVLGTGLGNFAKSVTDQISVPYHEIPHFPVSTVHSHSGQLIFGYKSGIPVVVMSGRLHYYEGYSSAELTFPIRVLAAIGIKHIIFTNAAGAVNPHFEEGDVVLVQDHINMMPDHPLRGAHDERLGLRFPDMMNAYSREKSDIFMKHATSLKIPLKTGVYLGLQGPSLETPAEYKMAHILGADLVGMSTVPEVIVAKHCNLAVSVFSVVSNVCFPKSHLSETTLENVIAVVNTASDKLEKIFNRYFEKYSD